tara:strand:+ start:2387 stop:2500 length:114 start_codon:yes stop_codon:yes gene_type:complete
MLIWLTGIKNKILGNLGLLKIILTLLFTAAGRGSEEV